jgi:hypothetical protein
VATIQEINSSIMFGDLTNEQLESVIMAVRYRRIQLSKYVKRNISVGSKVKFYNSKRNANLTGTVEKVAIKYVTVNCGVNRWRVPANMLEVL